MKPSKAYVSLFFLFMGASIHFSCLHGGSTMNSETEIKAETIYRGTNCPADQSEAYLRWIDSRIEFEEIWGELNAHRLGGSLPALPGVDFITNGLLMIHMGMQNTGGYALNLAESTVQVKDQIATVAVHWVSPPSDGLVAQVLTAPCLLLNLPKGKFHTIEVVDANGTLRLSIYLSALGG